MQGVAKVLYLKATKTNKLEQTNKKKQQQQQKTKQQQQQKKQQKTNSVLHFII
jgi:hypothetical protein